MKRMTIAMQLYIVVLLLLAVLMGAMYDSYRQTARILELQNADYTNRLLQQMEAGIGASRDSLAKLMESLVFNVEVQEFLKTDDPLARYNSNRRVVNLLANARAMHPGILDVIVSGSRADRRINATDRTGNVPVPETGVDPGLRCSSFMAIDYLGCNGFILSRAVYPIDEAATDIERIGMVHIVLEASAFAGVTGEPLPAQDMRIYLLDSAGTAY